MTDMRKICPSSGEKCDCPKGRCLIAVDELLASMNSSDTDVLHGVASEETRWQCPSCQSKGFTKSQLPDRCEFCDGTFSGNPPTEREIYYAQNADEQERMDAQEAGSIKYALTAKITVLTSGKFALFGPYSMSEGGIPLIKIAEWDDMRAYVENYRKQAEIGYNAEKEQEEARRKPAAESINYDDLFGES